MPRAHTGSESEHFPSIPGPSFNLGNKTTVGPSGDKLKYTHIKNYIKCTWPLEPDKMNICASYLDLIPKAIL